MLDQEAQTSDALKQKIRAECERALAEDGVGAGAIAPGCAGMADLCSELTSQLGEALVGLGMRTGKQGDDAPPQVKSYTGPMAQFVPTA